MISISYDRFMIDMERKCLIIEKVRNDLMDEVNMNWVLKDG